MKSTKTIILSFRYQYLYETDPREEMNKIGNSGIIYNYAGFIPQMVWDQ